ncbi:MAG: hypothetical protein H0U75_03270 [Legionella sp.]|nr:hypothetical protein [Legionella sp.]
MRSLFVRPPSGLHSAGSQQQNAYVGRYNRRYDWLSQYLFESITEVQLHATQIPLLEAFLHGKNGTRCLLKCSYL